MSARVVPLSSLFRRSSSLALARWASAEEERGRAADALRAVLAEPSPAVGLPICSGCRCFLDPRRGEGAHVSRGRQRRIESDREGGRVSPLCAVAVSGVRIGNADASNV